MQNNLPLSKKKDYINQDIDIKHRYSFLAKSYKINKAQSLSSSLNKKQTPLKQISKTVNIFDKSNNQLVSINQNIINDQEIPNQSKLVQFQLNSIKMYQIVGPLALRRNILKLNAKNNSNKLFLDTNMSIGTKINDSTMNNTNLKTKGKLNLLDNNVNANSPIIDMTSTQNLNNTGMNSTINRNSIISKKERDQQNIYTKDARQINRYREYKEQWERQSSNVKKKSNSYSLSIKKPSSSFNSINQGTSLINQKYQSKPHSVTLIDRAVKPLIIQKNRQREDILKNNVTRFWQMSLRNNNKELLQYMRGTKYQGAQFQELLQTSAGLKEVQKSIPSLNFRDQSNLAAKEGQRLVLSGKRKFDFYKQSMIQQTNRRIHNSNDEQIDLLRNFDVLKLNTVKKDRYQSNNPKSNEKQLLKLDQSIKGNESVSFSAKKSIYPQQEVYKINYDGRKHWLGTQGL